MTAVAAEGAHRHARTRRRLSPFKLALAQSFNHEKYNAGIIVVNQFGGRAVPLKQAVQNSVKNFIGREGVLIGLVGTQFRARRFG